MLMLMLDVRACSQTTGHERSTGCLRPKVRRRCRLVTVRLRLERALNRDVDVVSLLLRQRGELGAQVAEVAIYRSGNIDVLSLELRVPFLNLGLLTFNLFLLAE